MSLKQGIPFVREHRELPEAIILNDCQSSRNRKAIGRRAGLHSRYTRETEGRFQSKGSYAGPGAEAQSVEFI